MSLHPQPPSPLIPAETARVARAAFPKGNPYLTLRDDLGPVFADGDFDDLYPKRGQPAYPTSFHTNSVDLIEGCSRDNKIPQTL